MTTERQHTLVPCATCGTPWDTSWMVSVGDDWLCTQCAGAEIGRLRDKATTLHRERMRLRAEVFKLRHPNGLPERSREEREAALEMLSPSPRPPDWDALHSATEDADDRTT